MLLSYEMYGAWAAALLIIGMSKNSGGKRMRVNTKYKRTLLA